MTPIATGLVACPAAPADGVFAFPASASQQQLWLASDADPTGSAYNVTRAMTLNGPLDFDALRRAVAALIERHELLRTVFRRRGGSLQQVVLPRLAPSVEVRDLRASPPADRERACTALLGEEATRRFDLANGPLVRLTVTRLEAERNVLCLNLHHLICDAWSLSILFRELSAAYYAAAAGRPIDLGPAPLQYTDFAVWQHDLPGTAHVEKSLAFWRSNLADIPRLPLPTDLVRPDVASGLGGLVAERLDAHVMQQLRDTARAGKTTPFVVMIAAYAAFLHRWTGAADIPIGTPVTGRNRVELENVVGPFVNTVVARIRIDRGQTFREIVATTRRVALAAMEHADAPFGAVVSAMPEARASGRGALFRTMFAMQSVDSGPDRGALSAEGLAIDVRGAKHDLTIVALDMPQALVLTAEYSRDLFLERTVERALASFGQFLRSVAEAPDLDVMRARWLPDDRMPDAFCEGAAPAYPHDCSIYELFARVAAAHPAETAIEDGGRAVTYARLEQDADRVAGELTDRGARRGDRVALLMSRGPLFVAAALGVLKAGAVYVPIDPAYPDARAQFILDDARPAAVLRESDVARALERPTHGVPPVALRGGDAAAIMYTSGSTGTPKGVVVPHRAIARLVVHADYLQVRETDRVAHASNVAFDAATFEIFGALLNGATLVVLPAEDVASPALLARAVVDRALSVLFVTTAVFNQVARDAPGAFASLRALLFGGEASSPAAVARVVEAGKPRTLLHVYGPTESTTFATAFIVDRADTRPATVPIGRPIAHTRARLLDALQQPVPQGVVGELYLGGDGLALGYHADAALTAERFIPDPFAPGERLYRTGDRCRVNATEEIEFVERADRQLKLRGFRIEPAEVEHALCADDRVAQAAIDVHGTDEARRLVAAVVLRPGCAATVEELRAAAAARLPAFMVPSVIHLTNELPLTPSGKIDRQRIAGVANLEPVPARSLAPRDPLESDIARIWEQMLGVSPVGITDDFFALGGHSLLAAAMLDRVEELVGRRISISTLLREPTVQGLASAFWRDEAGSAQAITVMREDGERPPLFYIHGDINGGGVYSRRLMHALPPDQPFYALAPPVAGNLRAAPSIEAMANDYIALIRQIRPDGPIALGGYCHGALVAYEIARRLKRERVVATVVMVHPSRVAPKLRAFAALVNAYCAVRRSSESERVRTTVRAIDFLAVLTQTPAAQLGSWLAAKAMRIVKGPVPATVSSRAAQAVERHDPEIWATIVHAVQAFVPRRYDGRVALLVVPAAGDGARARGWTKAARNAVIVEVSGDHHTCVTTHVEELAAAIDHELARAMPQSV
jgi:amino acid adenylation domain-containing protein